MKFTILFLKYRSIRIGKSDRKNDINNMKIIGTSTRLHYRDIFTMKVNYQRLYALSRFLGCRMAPCPPVFFQILHSLKEQKTEPWHIKRGKSAKMDA
jgi:hypothetical protein